MPLLPAGQLRQMADHRVEGAEALKVGKSLGTQCTEPQCQTVTNPGIEQLSKCQKLHNTVMAMNEQALALFKERCPDVWFSTWMSGRSTRPSLATPLTLGIEQRRTLQF